MKIALVTTTIFVPRVLAAYRRLGPDVAFFVAGDRKTPHEEVRAFLRELGGEAVYLSDDDQQRLGFECSEIIGWNTIPRRNIALLQAIASGADIVVTIDDDNLPIGLAYFDDLRDQFAGPRQVLVADSESHWFNVGDFVEPRVYHRGFPHELRGRDQRVRLSIEADIDIGIAAGVILGDPDIDAVDRISQRPIVRHASSVLDEGIAVAPRCVGPFNSQNTAARGDLASLLMVLPGIGRHQDIWASFIAQRVMQETKHRVHYGKPYVWQERTPQSPWQNLREELLGMEVGARLVDDLNELAIEAGSVVDRLRAVFEGMSNLEYVPDQAWRFGLAWCRDLDGIYGR